MKIRGRVMSGLHVEWMAAKASNRLRDVMDGLPKASMNAVKYMNR